MHKPNLLLESDVQEELDWDPQVDRSRIVVKADDGRVTLSGSVPTYVQMLRAADDARVVGGVSEVDNGLLLVVLPARRSTTPRSRSRARRRSTPTSSSRREPSTPRF
jgi:hypothetical protein